MSSDFNLLALVNEEIAKLGAKQRPVEMYSDSEFKDRNFNAGLDEGQWALEAVRDAIVTAGGMPVTAAELLGVEERVDG